MNLLLKIIDWHLEKKNENYYIVLGIGLEISCELHFSCIIFSSIPAENSEITNY